MAKLGGTQGSYGQTNGQLRIPGRRRVVRIKVGGMGPTRIARKHHQSWCCGTMAAAAGQYLALQLCLDGWWDPQKIHKNNMVLRPWS